LSAPQFSLRQILLALVFIGIVGLIIELLLLGHTESLSQWIPLAVLAAGLISTVLMAFRPADDTVRIFQVIMTVFVLTGVLGLYLHYRGNVEFALERDPSATGLRLVWKALTGATPTLAPGALAQLGLLGLACTYSRTRANDRSKETRERVE
jgi:hypothetical protein